jgi:NAD-dependent SIR2 family protein deacetylase
MVFSSYRFVRRAHELSIPIAAINDGVTRGDKLFDFKVVGDCSEILAHLL